MRWLFITRIPSSALSLVGENQLVAQFMDLGYNKIFDMRVQRICPDVHPEKQVWVILRLKEADKVFNK